MTVYTCPTCSELFRKTYLGGPFPGGKEKEDIDCPTCGHTVATEMTSSVLSTKALSAEEKAAHLAGRDAERKMADIEVKSTLKRQD